MLLKYIQEGLSVGLKVHDPGLRFQISRLSMHVPDGVLTDVMGTEDCFLMQWGLGYVHVCGVCEGDGGWLSPHPPRFVVLLYAPTLGLGAGVDLM